nr:MAG TPA: hypothetical protein [Caudoviricetes sp.]
MVLIRFCPLFRHSVAGKGAVFLRQFVVVFLILAHK